MGPILSGGNVSYENPNTIVEQAEIFKSTELRANMAQTMAEELVGFKGDIDLDQYCIAMFGLSSEEGVEADDKNVIITKDLVDAVTNESLQGLKIELRAPKQHNGFTPLLGRLASFSSEEFKPVNYRIRPGTKLTDFESWYSNLEIAVENDSNVVAVPLMQMFSYIKPATKPTRRSEGQPHSLGMCPLNAGYVQLVLSGEVYGRSLLEKPSRQYDGISDPRD